MFSVYSEGGYLSLIDTQREKDISVGTKYPFEPMKSKECTISSQLASRIHVKKGDIMFVGVDVYHLMMALIRKFNLEVAVKRGLPNITDDNIQQN